MRWWSRRRGVAATVPPPPEAGPTPAGPGGSASPRGAWARGRARRPAAGPGTGPAPQAGPDPAAPPPAAPLPAPPRRRAGRWVGGGLAALLALLLAALWLGPGLLDWGAWRPQIAEIASARLGRPVTLGGRVTLSLLPQPRVEAAEVAIGDQGDGLRIDARALRLRLDLGALIAGRLEPREIAIIGGEIRLPWPPEALPSFRPPAWLTALDARLEDCRLLVGGLRLEGLNARLVTGGINEALVADGSFAWRGTAVRFAGQLGRAGFDGAAPLDLSLAGAGATLAARGVLAPGGGFEGSLEAAGTDLSALLPAPALPFRATGRLTATEEVIAAAGLGLDLGGQPARGAAALRLVPEPRLDIAILAGRLDLDAWIAAARQAGPRSIPVGIDLSAEATAIGGLPLRRLRGGFFLEGERLSLSDVSAVLPGETAVELAGATAAGGQRLELAVRFASASLREALAAFGLPLEGMVDPARLRQAEGRFRLALQEGQATLSELEAVVDGARVAGAGVVRPGPRPSVGLGLTLDRLDLDGLLPEAPPDWAGLPARLSAFDLNLRLAAGEVELRAASGLPVRRAALDATLEGGRLVVRRLGFRLAELDVALTGTAALGQGPTRFSDLALELGGSAGGGLVATLLPAAWTERLALPAELPVALRLAGGGPPEALALRAEGDLGELRLEAQATLDVPGRRGGGGLTLRHPGAPRLLAPLLGQGEAALAEWLGQGSFSLIAQLAATPQGAAAEHLDLVAGGLRARGQLALALAGDRPRLTGRLAAERLPLPDPLAPDAGPVPWQRLAGLDAELALRVGRVEVPGLPALEEATATLALGEGALRTEGLAGRLGGGALEGRLGIAFGGPGPPVLGLEARLEDATVGAPLFGLPFDIGAGRLRLETRLEARGHGLDGLAATLGGELRLALRDGQLIGYDLPAVQAAAALPGLAAAEAALRRALLAPGATAFERLELEASIAEGLVALRQGEIGSEAGATAAAGGRIDLARRVLDLELATTPVAGAPAIGLRLGGPVAEPRRQPELAPFLRWKAQQDP